MYRTLYEKGQKQSGSHSCIELSKTQFFLMSIVKARTTDIASLNMKTDSGVLCNYLPYLPYL